MHDRHREGLWQRYVAHIPYFQGLRIASYHLPLNLIDRTEYLTKIFATPFATTTAREFERC